MSEEREVRKETDFWGNEKEVIYENDRKVGEVKTEERSGFFGIGGESVKVEYDTSGSEVSYSKQEERGGFLGIGAEQVEVRYDSSNKEIGHSRVEERGGFFGIGGHHARVEYDNDQNEISQTNTERRGHFLGIGGERVRVTRYSKTDANDIQREVGTTTRTGSDYAASSGEAAPSSRQAPTSSSVGGFWWAIFVVVLVTAFIAMSNVRSPRRTPAIAIPTPQVRQPVVPMIWGAQNRLSVRGFGVLRIGMTYEEVKASLNGKISREPETSDDCYYAKPSEPSAGIYFMFTNGGKLSRIEIKSSSYLSRSGAYVGQDQASLVEMYAGRLNRSPHKYDDAGYYFTYEPTDAEDANYRTIFETDGKKVTTFRAGQLPEVAYVEGCL